MRWSLLGFACGFVVVFGGRVLWGGASSSDAVPPPPNAPYAELPEPTTRLPRPPPPSGPTAATDEAPHPQPAPPPARAPDLQPFDDLIAHFYGDPTPWDHPELQQATEARLEAGAAAFAEAGLGQILHLDCDSYPCLGVAETDLPGPEVVSQLVEHLGGEVHVWSFNPVPVAPGAEETVTRLVFGQDTEDLSPWDPHLQLRKEDLQSEYYTSMYYPPPDQTDPPRAWPAAPAPRSR